MRRGWFGSAVGQIRAYRFERFLDPPQLVAQRIEKITLGDHERIELLHLIVEKGEARLEIGEALAVDVRRSVRHQRIRIFTPCSCR